MSKYHNLTKKYFPKENDVQLTVMRQKVANTLRLRKISISKV